MDLNSILKIGDKIEVISLDRNKETIYISQIDGIYDGFLEVFNPIHKSNLVYFRDDETVKIFFAKKDAVYEITAKVFEKSFGKISMIKLRIISDIKKTQRRNYYRLKITRSIRLKKISSKKEENYKSEYHDGILVDISGGGMLFFSKYELNKDDLVEIEITINANNLIKIYGIVLRKIFNIEKSFLYEYGVKFKNIKAKDKDALIKFIFDEQRKLLKRGLS